MNTLPLEDMKLTPMGWPFMADAYLGCVSFALSNDDIKRAFKDETGHDLDELASTQGVAQLIDDATGRTSAVMALFMDFVTKTVWGEEVAQ